MPSHLSPGALTALLLHTGLRFICIPSILLDIHIFYSFVVTRDRPPYVLWPVALLPLMPLGLAVSINVLGRSFGGPVIAADAILLVLSVTSYLMHITSMLALKRASYYEVYAPICAGDRSVSSKFLEQLP